MLNYKSVVMFVSEVLFLQAATNENITPEEMLEHITSVWSDKLALVSSEERRKLCALGLAYLCGSGWPPVMKVWPAAITAIVEVVYDVTVEDSTQDKLVSFQNLVFAGAFHLIKVEMN